MQANERRQKVASLLPPGSMEMAPDLKLSHGSWIRDVDSGKEFLDCFTYFASHPLGHNPPCLNTPEAEEVLLRAAKTKPSSSDFYTDEMVEFVETFERTAKPAEFSYLFFISGGGVAVANGLKAAFDWKVRKNLAKGLSDKIQTEALHFKQAFHGRTGYTLSLTNTADPRKTAYFPQFDWPRVSNPKIVFPLNEENLAAVKKQEEQSVAEIKQAFVDRPDRIAAIIIEPIQGEGGDNHFRPEFLQTLRQLADENEALLIFDEVQTGVGLTGKFWAYQHYGLTPDIVCFGKKMQVCGVMAGKRMDEVENHVFAEASRINSTWGGNLVDMVRSSFYLKEIEEKNLVQNAQKVGDCLLKGLKEVVSEFSGSLSNARGKGLMCAFDASSPEQRDKIVNKAYENGLLILSCGTHSVRFRPSLCFSESDVAETIVRLRASLKDC